MGHSTIAVSGNAGFSAQNLLSLVIVTGRMGHDLHLINVAFSTLHFRSIVWYKHNVHVTRVAALHNCANRVGERKRTVGALFYAFSMKIKALTRSNE